MPGEDALIYDVALSYAGKDRPRARLLAEALRRRGLRVFTDDDQGAAWGEVLPDFLFDLYRRRARRCVMLVSASYSERQWTVLERMAAQARAQEEAGYVLPVRLDGSDVPGPLSVLGFVDWPPADEESIAALVVQKLGRAGDPPSLVVDDVFVEPRGDHMVLDVRIRNAGPEVVNVTRADVHVLQRDEMLSAYRASAIYQVMLKDEHNVVAVGHALQPGEVDAFRIEVGFTSNCCGLAEVILQYNGDRQARSRELRFQAWD
jgi:hypothetical protein